MTPADATGSLGQVCIRKAGEADKAFLFELAPRLADVPRPR
jgi:hypothetical protein